LDIIKTADYIIDMGPEGGAQGGQIIATGTPEQLVKKYKSSSPTAYFLQEELN
jgi:excinuclease ABC subunit A